MKQQIFAKTVYGHKKLIGIFEDGIATLYVYERHFFRKAGTFGIDADVYEKLIQGGCRQIDFLVGEDFAEFRKGQKIVFDLAAFQNKCWKHQFGNFEPKYFCALDHAKVVDPPSREEREVELLKKALQ